jgi:spore maturation protein CgeB
VQPLLQCTDPRLFHPGDADTDQTGPVLFVGNSRGVFRPALQGALQAGVPVEIHGKGWEEFIDPTLVASRMLAYTELGRAYSHASVVLNDHWDDMKREGFVSNRLFDAGACAARIVTDEVTGVADLFGPLVRVFSDADELASLLRDPDSAFGARSERLRWAERVRTEHSFDARAGVLVETAASLVRREADERAGSF